MEEWVGKVWHRLITGAANPEHAAQAVTLEEMRPLVSILFRALGGDGGLKVEAATATEHKARRNWLQRIAGSGGQVELAWRDAETLRLPEYIALFADQALNRDLYIWLAALAAGAGAAGDWFLRNQRQAAATLARYPGLVPRYRRLVEHYLALRPDPSGLPHDEAAQERAIRSALEVPGSIDSFPAAAQAPFPVHLWLHPEPPIVVPAKGAAEGSAESDGEGKGESREPEKRRRRKAQQVDMPEGKDGLLGIRMEALFSWAEYIQADRTTEEDEDENADRAVDDLDFLSIARDGKSTASRLRLDLDLPGAEYDDIPLGGGIRLPEWDYRRREMLPDHCRVVPMLARDARPMALPEPLRRSAHRLRGQFQALAQTRIWRHGQNQGSEFDLDAYLSLQTARRQGQNDDGQGLYREFQRRERDLACLLLADLSLSTDAAVNNQARVVDVIRDSLFLFAEALDATGDRFAMYGFSSRRREEVRLQLLKEFAETYSDRVRGRIGAIKPGYYTRMGAAIRYATERLATQPAARQLLLLLTDGKPNDLDRYEGRHGIEDTRQALIEARKQGLFPFCVTIDREAGDYLPHLFGPGGFVVIRRPEELPRRLPILYVKLTE